MSKTIATILTLKDTMSGGILKASKNIQGMSKEMKKATNDVAKMSNNFKNKIDEMSTKAVKFGVASAGVVAGLAAKAGFSEAFDMEGYRVQLETATKDTKKASQLMSDAVKFANATPFETGEVVQATAKMEMYGLSSKRWLGDVADMAGSTNKTIDQATEAMADVSVGEFERIKEFGITKDQILLASNKKYGKGLVINAKGQVVDQTKLMDTVQSMMQQKFKGGAEKLAGTTKGLWSTITGITKSSLANIVGMQSDGTIKQGSLMDQVKIKIKQIADQFQKMQDDGTITRIATKVTDTFNKIYNIIKKVIDFMVEHKTAIENFAIAFLSFAIAIKIVNGLKLALGFLKLMFIGLDGAIMVTPIGWLLLGIAAVIAIGILLWKNWDTVKAKADDLCFGIKVAFQNVGTFLANIFKDIANGFIVNTLNPIIKALNLLPGVKIKTIAEFQKGTYGSLTRPTSSSADRSYEAASNKKTGGGGVFANGTNYAPGGPSLVGEKGPEIVNLKKGSTVTTADKTKKLLKGNGMIVNVTIQGNVIGNEQYADYVATRIAKKLNEIEPNMA